MEIELPDGTILEAPEGADVKRVVAGYMAAQRRAKTVASDPSEYDPASPEWRAKYGAGAPDVLARVGRGMLDVGQGLKELTLQEPYASQYRDKVNSDLELYDRGRAEAGGGVDWARAAGNVAATAPVGAGVGLPATLAARLGAGAATGAVAGGAMYSPTGDRTANAVGGAALGGAVPVAGGVLRNTVAGLRARSPQAAQLLAEGVPLTSGQVSGGAAQTMEQMLGKLPFSGPAIRARQTEALQGWNQNLLNAARPGAEEIGASGQQGMRELTKQLDDAYDALWNRDLKLKDGRTVAGRSIGDTQKRLRDSAYDALRRGEREQAEELFASRDGLLNQLDDSVVSELRRLDTLYRDFAALRQAGSYTKAAERGGVFTPQQLLGAARRVDRSAGKGRTAQGTAPMQQQAQQAAQVLGDAKGPSASVLERTAGAIPGLLARPLYGRTTQRYLRGGTRWQRTLADWHSGSPTTRALITALRQQGSPAAVSVSTAPDNE